MTDWCIGQELRWTALNSVRPGERLESFPRHSGPIGSYKGDIPARVGTMIVNTEHRPYPPPATAWTGHMVWNELLFAHWALPPETLQRLLPASVPLDTFDGQGYLTIAPFRMTEVRPRNVPTLPWLSAFPELNVRTYTTVDGQPGVFFFSLDVTSLAAVLGARAVYFLPYFLAQMSVTHEGGWIHYDSHRSRWHGSAAHFVGRYRAEGEVFHAQPGSLDHWLTERYCLYSVDSRDQLFRAQIHHEPWPLQKAEAAIFRNTMASSLGIELTEVPTLMHYASRLEVLAWLPERVAPSA